MQSQGTMHTTVFVGLWLLLLKGAASETLNVYAAVNGSVMLNIPKYTYSEGDQVVWTKNNTLMVKTGKIPIEGCACELQKNGSLYLKDLTQTKEPSYRVQIHNKVGKNIVQQEIQVTLLERVSSPDLTYKCTEKTEIQCKPTKGENVKIDIYWNGKQQTIDKQHKVVKSDKTGQAKCTASNKVSTESISIEVHCSKGGPVPEEMCLEWRALIRLEMWEDALENWYGCRGKVLPSPEQRFGDQVNLRLCLLRDQLTGEGIAELKCLVQREVELEDRYRALYWFADRRQSRAETHYSPEVVDFGGPGLLWEAFEEKVDFGSPEEYRFWDIQSRRFDGLLTRIEAGFIKERLALIDGETEIDAGGRPGAVQLNAVDFQAAPGLPEKQQLRNSNMGGSGTTCSSLAQLDSGLLTPVNNTAEWDIFLILSVAGGAVAFLIFLILLIYCLKRRCRKHNQTDEEEPDVCPKNKIQTRQLPEPPCQPRTHSLPRGPSGIPEQKPSQKLPLVDRQTLPVPQPQKTRKHKQRPQEQTENLPEQQKNQMNTQKPSLPPNHPTGQPPRPQPRSQAKPPRHNRKKNQLID
ncbi:T-cell surface antigen CD2 [Bombina bombina]|uniref:T-cell surface antigen CD2 n=1 Tax=Bombina bombina TaxID=8345 RepID=UPI00235B26AF|nr:T-cell surface antigen CD2 [Bombina bombina]